MPGELDTADPHLFSRLNQTQYMPDLWLQFLWEGLRVELEAAFVAGTLEGGCPKLVTDGSRRIRIASASRPSSSSPATDGRPTSGQCKFRQLGVALESEYRLFDDRLGMLLHVGRRHR